MVAAAASESTAALDMMPVWVPMRGATVGTGSTGAEVQAMGAVRSMEWSAMALGGSVLGVLSVDEDNVTHVQAASL